MIFDYLCHLKNQILSNILTSNEKILIIISWFHSSTYDSHDLVTLTCTCIEFHFIFTYIFIIRELYSISLVLSTLLYIGVNKQLIDIFFSNECLIYLHLNHLVLLSWLIYSLDLISFHVRNFFLEVIYQFLG